MTRVVELRIHGVSGTPAEEMLDCRFVTQVAGDVETRFFRRADSDGRPLSEDPDHVVEGYHWGQLTSGSWTKALWLILVPFGILNAAHFMIPAGQHSFPAGTSPGPGKTEPTGHQPERPTNGWKRCRWLSRAALRALGAVLTGILVLVGAEVLVDLLAWQWTALVPTGQSEQRVADPRWWVAAALLVVAVLMPLLVWFAGSRAVGPYELQAPVPPDLADAELTKTELTGPEFERSDDYRRVLSWLHMAFGIGVPAVIGISIVRKSAGVEANWYLTELPYLLSWVLLGATLVLVFLISPASFRKPGQSGRRMATWLRGIALTMIAAASIVLLTAIAVVLFGPASKLDRQVVPGIDDLTFAALTLTLAFLLLMFVTVAVAAAGTGQREIPKAFRRYAWGVVSVPLAAIAVFVGVGFGSAIVFSTFKIFQPAQGEQLSIPLIYVRIAHAWGQIVVIAVLVGLVVGVCYLLQRPKFRQRVTTAHAVPDTAKMAAFESAHVADAWWLARFKFHLHRVLILLAVAGLAMSIFAAVGAFHEWRAAHSSSTAQRCDPEFWTDSWDWPQRLTSCDSNAGRNLYVALGIAALVLIGARLVVLGRHSLKDSSKRRTTNLIWDVIAFWPRMAHPLVPPPYTAKALDQLRSRIYWHLGRHPADGAEFAGPRAAPAADLVVVAAHSQGSLIAVAALAGMHPVVHSQVRLLTFGSQLQFAYARGFPAYVNPPFLARISALLRSSGRAGWISLVRETDPIGGQVLSWQPTYEREPRSVRLAVEGQVPSVADQRRADGQQGRTGEHPGWTGGGDTVDRLTGVRRCGDDWRLLDPAPADGIDGPRLAMRKHSGYSQDPVWLIAMDALVATSAPTGVGTDPPSPSEDSSQPVGRTISQSQPGVRHEVQSMAIVHSTPLTE
ncbi:MAG: hypothetical protein ABWZ98_16515 [Nakamurella sp.]